MSDGRDWAAFAADKSGSDGCCVTHRQTQRPRKQTTSSLEWSSFVNSECNTALSLPVKPSNPWRLCDAQRGRFILQKPVRAFHRPIGGWSIAYLSHFALFFFFLLFFYFLIFFCGLGPRCWLYCYEFSTVMANVGTLARGEEGQIVIWRLIWGFWTRFQVAAVLTRDSWSTFFFFFLRTLTH